MASINSIIDRIKDLIGDEVTNIVSYKDLINDAFNHVADLIPNDSQIWNSGINNDVLHYAFSNSFNALSNTDNIKIIRIIRKDFNGNDRVVKEVPYEQYLKGQDETSIYYHAKDEFNPIYTISADGSFKVSPPNLSGAAVKAYYYKYLTDEDITTLTDIDTHVNGDIWAFPRQALQLAILLSCSNLLQAKMSDAVQEEEDLELVQLLNAQIASIDKSTQKELQKLTIPHKMIGVDDDIK